MRPFAAILWKWWSRCRRGFCRTTWHRRGAGRHNHRRVGVPVGDSSVNFILIVGAIAGERGHRIRDLIEQGADLSAVIDVFAGQRRSHDLAGLSIDTEVQFPPGPAPLGAMLLNQPLAGTASLQPRAVHQEV